MRKGKQIVAATVAVLFVGSVWNSSPLVAQVQNKNDAEELKRFQGTWETVAQENAAGKRPLDEIPIVLLVVKGDQWTFKTRDGNGGVAKIVLLDPKAKPARISLEIGGLTFHGIYRFEKDLLITNVGDSNDPPPTDFRPTKAASGAVTTHRRKAMKD